MGKFPKIFLFLVLFFAKLALASEIFGGVFINEILPNPEGSDEKEWIEIFNQEDFEVDLSGWKISDRAGKTKTYIFPRGTKIPAMRFLVLKRETTKIVLNNDGDGLNLIGPDGKIADEVSYTRAPEGKSLNRTENGWVWSSNLTPGGKNFFEKILKQKEEFFEEEKQLAFVSQKIPQFLINLSIALSIAIFSAIVFLILKRKLLKKENF